MHKKLIEIILNYIFIVCGYDFKLRLKEYKNKLFLNSEIDRLHVNKINFEVDIHQLPV